MYRFGVYLDLFLGSGLRWRDVKGYIMWLPVWQNVFVASVRLGLCVSMALMSADRPRPRGSSVARPGWGPRALWLQDCPDFHCKVLPCKGWWWKRMTPQGWAWTPWPLGIQGPAQWSEQPVKDWEVGGGWASLAFPAVASRRFVPWKAGLCNMVCNPWRKITKWQFKTVNLNRVHVGNFYVGTSRGHL